MKEKSAVKISQQDKDILKVNISSIELPSGSDDTRWTVEMHVYDLSENKILSVHNIPRNSWLAYDGIQAGVEEEEEIGGSQFGA